MYNLQQRVLCSRCAAYPALLCSAVCCCAVCCAVCAGAIGDEQVEMGLQVQLNDVLESWRGGEQAELVRIEQERAMYVLILQQQQEHASSRTPFRLPACLAG